jgi:hypothetical protein
LPWFVSQALMSDCVFKVASCNGTNQSCC